MSTRVRQRGHRTWPVAFIALLYTAHGKSPRTTRAAHEVSGRASSAYRLLRARLLAFDRRRQRVHGERPIVGRVADVEPRRIDRAVLLRLADHDRIEDAGREQGPLDRIRRVAADDHRLDRPEQI